MPYFEKRATKRVILPSDKSLWVDVYTRFNWKQEKQIGEAVKAGRYQADAIMESIIADWNLEDEKGIAPIDAEHIDLLNRDDAIAIIDAVNGLAVVDEDNNSKKASSSES